jgi:hypothetical protein
VNIGVHADSADSGAIRSARVPTVNSNASSRRILIHIPSVMRRISASPPSPCDHIGLERIAGFVIVPCAVDKAAGERQFIGAALVLAQHLNGQIRRRLALAIELRQPFFARCHFPVPTFRSSCSVAAPTSTNFGKSWALANLLILVPPYRSEVPDRTRRLWCRDFRSAVPVPPPFLLRRALARLCRASSTRDWGSSVVASTGESCALNKFTACYKWKRGFR